MRRLFLIIPVLLVMAACSRTHPYLEGDGNLVGGYYDRRLEENVWVVGFNSRGYTNEAATRWFMLLRAAVIGKKHGYRYFFEGSFEDQSKSRTQLGSNSSGVYLQSKKEPHFKSTFTFFVVIPDNLEYRFRNRQDWHEVDVVIDYVKGRYGVEIEQEWRKPRYIE